jgi:hypothetical protein
VGSERRTTVPPRDRKALKTVGTQTKQFAWPRVFLVFVLGFLPVCNVTAQEPATQNTAPGTPEAAKPASPGYEVIILEPVVRFENIKDESVPPDYAGANGVFVNRLVDTAKNEVESRKLGVAKPEAFTEPSTAEQCKQLEPLSSRLARGIVNDEAKEILSRLAAINDRDVLLVQSMRVKLGPGRSWDQFTGAITSAMNSTVLHAALVSCKTGQVLWKNEVLVRKVMKPDSPAFIKTLGLLYQTLELK